MEDIAPALSKKINAEFQKAVNNDKWIQSMFGRIRDGTVKMEDGSEYAARLGDHVAEAFQKVLTQEALPDGKMYWNIAERTIKPALIQNYDLTNSTAAKIQKAIDTQNGVGLNSVTGNDPSERINQICNGICEDGAEWETVQQRMDAPVRNCSQAFFDDFIKANAEFRYKSGREPMIVRTAVGHCCKWCQEVAGKYKYSEVRATGSDVYRRHDNCRCTVTYVDDGGSMQDVWSKARWQPSQEDLEKMKTVGLDNIDATVVNSAERKKAVDLAAQNKLTKEENDKLRREWRSSMISGLEEHMNMSEKQATLYYNTHSDMWYTSPPGVKK